MQALSLTETTREAALKLAQNAVAKHIDLALEADTDIQITGSPTLLHELVSNLLDNAIRYTPAHGKITLRVLAEATSTTMPASRAPSWKWKTPAAA